MPTNLIKTSEVDVLIIGAGPAGLMACNALAKAGISVRIVDQRPNKVAAGQADGIQPRTIEVLQSYGLADRLLTEGNQLHMAAFYNPSPDTGGIELTDRIPDVSETATPYPFELTLHQGAIEAIFLDSMRGMGVEVSRPVIPISMQLSEKEKHSHHIDVYPVRVTLQTVEPMFGQAKTEVVHTKYVIGADGAHSWVRKRFGIAMEGEQTEYIWGVVDMVPETNFPDIRNRTAIHSNNGSCMIIPREGDKVRLYIQLGDNAAVDSASGRVDKDKVGPHKLLDVAKKSFYPYTIETPESFDWWTIYTIGQRVASKYCVDERIFIAGDACHTHSPKAGQGMNASMNDTHNLAWKLIHVIRGWARPSLLKTYELERRTYAQDLISFDKEFAKLFSQKPKTQHNKEGVSHEDFLKAFQTFGGFTSGIGIHYGESSIVATLHQSYARGLSIGKRMPPQILIRAADARPFELQDLLPSDTRFKVLIFAGDTSQATQRAKVDNLAVDMSASHRFLKTYSPSGDIFAAFDILSISSATKSEVRYNELPKLFRSHWSKVFIDDQEARGRRGGDAYTNYGIYPTGVVVIVRPDGYVGMIAPFDKLQDVDQYFRGFTSGF
ncbi:FAD binding domain-containing protein [Collybia nuda]|uniref:FAD binding domain-containing protein n=1 Tax=Collybia nuda TaxID=64659 RepID=A0A9P6CMY3_9AGAR|nr:FAD binding domain-containing protein [Collybia nuda]